jgi:hypothetical protein
MVAGALGLGVVVLVGFAIIALGGDLLSQSSRQVATDRATVSAPSAQLTASASAPQGLDDRLPRGSADLTPDDASASSIQESHDDPGDGLDAVTTTAAIPEATSAVPSASSSALSASSAASAVSSVAALPSVDATAIMASNVAPSTASSPMPTSFALPADYCRAVNTSDSPDAAKITGGLAALTSGARTQAAMPQGEVRWRCMDAAVWVCVQPSGGLSCDKVPSSVDRVLICASHPDAKGIRTAAGDWSCDGFTPVVTQAQLSAPDRRGFDKGAWRRLDPSSTAASQ